MRYVRHRPLHANPPTPELAFGGNPTSLKLNLNLWEKGPGGGTLPF